MFYFFAAVSMLLCVAVTMIGIRSFSTTYEFCLVRPLPDRSYWAQTSEYDPAIVYLLFSARGELALRVRSNTCVDHGVKLHVDRYHFHAIPAEFLLPPKPFGALGFYGGETPVPRPQYIMGGVGFRPGDSYVLLPHWTIVLLTSILPLLALMRMLKNHSLNAGLCVKCGYDVRVTPDRCPEFGTVVKPHEETHA
jgi:hypothetical protein